MSSGLSGATRTSASAAPGGSGTSSTRGRPPISCKRAARTRVAYETMRVYRTPDSRFDGLPGWSFEPRYLDQDGLRMHYVDEGTGKPTLLLHGEPTWGYLYRRMIPRLAAAG